jgi:hypothetical protein
MVVKNSFRNWKSGRALAMQEEEITGWRLSQSLSTHLLKWMILRFPIHEENRVYQDDCVSRQQKSPLPSAVLILNSIISLTPNNPPLYQLRRLYPLRPCVFQRRSPSVFALESELVFLRELGHIWRPLSLGLPVTVIFVGTRFMIERRLPSKWSFGIFLMIPGRRSGGESEGGGGWRRQSDRDGGEASLRGLGDILRIDETILDYIVSVR